MVEKGLLQTSAGFNCVSAIVQTEKYKLAQMLMIFTCSIIFLADQLNTFVWLKWS